MLRSPATLDILQNKEGQTSISAIEIERAAGRLVHGAAEFVVFHEQRAREPRQEAMKRLTVQYHD